MAAFWVKLGANGLNCVDVPLNPTHSLTVEPRLVELCRYIVDELYLLQMSKKLSHLNNF